MYPQYVAFYEANGVPWKQHVEEVRLCNEVIKRYQVRLADARAEIKELTK